MSREERTGWRDREYSKRHRLYGRDCPALDVDFLEYDRGKVVALVECKHRHARRQDLSHPTYRALIDLGDRAEVPVLLARHAEDFSWWIVTPLNDLAKNFVPEKTVLTEKGWVTLLYHVRGRELPGRLLFDDGGKLIQADAPEREMKWLEG